MGAAPGQAGAAPGGGAGTSATNNPPPLVMRSGYQAGGGSTGGVPQDRYGGYSQNTQANTNAGVRLKLKVIVRAGNIHSEEV